MFSSVMFVLMGNVVIRMVNVVMRVVVSRKMG